MNENLHSREVGRPGVQRRCCRAGVGRLPGDRESGVPYGPLREAVVQRAEHQAVGHQAAVEGRGFGDLAMERGATR